MKKDEKQKEKSPVLLIHLLEFSRGKKTEIHIIMMFLCIHCFHRVTIYSSQCA